MVTRNEKAYARHVAVTGGCEGTALRNRLVVRQRFVVVALQFPNGRLKQRFEVFNQNRALILVLLRLRSHYLFRNTLAFLTITSRIHLPTLVEQSRRFPIPSVVFATNGFKQVHSSTNESMGRRLFFCEDREWGGRFSAG